MTEQKTEVRLLSVPLDKNYNHTLYFPTLSDQITYFKGQTKFTALDCSYQRKEGFIRYPAHLETIEVCNYVMFRNGDIGSGKWKYGFITRMEYKSDGVTWIYFELDVMQTYLLNHTVRPSFVEREHTDNDIAGNHTFPENLECGEFVCHYKQVDSTLTALHVVMATSEPDPLVEDVTGEEGSSFMRRYRGTVSGLIYNSWPIDQLSKAQEAVERFDEAGKADAIQSIFLLPSFVAQIMEGTTENPIIPDHTQPASFEISVGGGITGVVDGSYNPRNKKLLTFPYKYLMVSNNSGASAIYHYELFNKAASGMKFKVYGTMAPGGSVRMLPLNYKGVPESNEEGLNLGKYPICNWTSDAYTNWLTQNAVNIGLNMVAGAGQIVSGGVMAIATGGAGLAAGGGSVVGGVSTIANQLAQIHQMSLTPDQSRGNINSGDITAAMNQNTFTFYAMSIKREYAEIIDSFFDMFGYKVNKVKTPLKNHRESYWYTKTIDASVSGDIPQDYLEKIRACYNNGITFWRSTVTLGDYSVSNNPL